MHKMNFFSTFYQLQNCVLLLTVAFILKWLQNVTNGSEQRINRLKKTKLTSIKHFLFIQYWIQNIINCNKLII